MRRGNREVRDFHFTGNFFFSEQNGQTLDVNAPPDEDAVWLFKEQISILFGRDRSVISRHINSIYEEGELDKESTCANNARIPQTEKHF